MRAAIETCSLRRESGSYHALTAYQLNWSYTTSASEGLCQLREVRVGLHVNQYLPDFVSDTTTSLQLSASWQRYIANLKTHEDGHTALNVAYATELTTALQNLGSLDCATLTTQVKTTIDSHITLLNTANELYDSRTNHGATQGAIL